MKWHTVSFIQVLQELSVDESGLSAIEAEERMKIYGPNKLPEERRKTWLEFFLRQFQSPIIYILFIAAVIVGVMGEASDSVIILGVLVINAIIGAVQEGRAQQTLDALAHMVETKATVLRKGKEVILQDVEIVPGDILVLKEGDKIAADARLISVSVFRVDESALTGESEAVVKSTDALRGADLTAADQRNMVFKGTYVLGGYAQAVVVATGVKTVIGSISEKLSHVDTEMPLKASIDALSRVIIYAVIAISLVIFIIGLLKGFELKEMFITVVAIAVSVIPEGLPVVVTVILAVGMYRMSKRNALVKKLQAVEALGQAKVIALDKTGTVTLNQMMVEQLYAGGELYQITGNGYEPVGTVLQNGVAVEHLEKEDILLAGKVASLVSFAEIAFSEEKKMWQRLSGDPTDAALRVFSQKLGFDKMRLEHSRTLVQELPFDSSFMYHAMIHEIAGDGRELSVSGAPEVIIGYSNHIWKNGKAVPLEKADTEELEKTLEKMMKEGFRVIGLAVRQKLPENFNIEAPEGLCLVGLVAISDSIREEVFQAVQDAREAGVRVVMITGDHVETGRAIALKAGIYSPGDKVLSGKDMQHMTDTELAGELSRVTVFARIAPETKLRIIEAYRRRGEIIAMTGDGVNDALSLAAADLGVSMGKDGTEVAKEASDIVLLDDNFGSIVAAIEEGRNIYQTIKRVILYLFSTSLGEIVAISVAISLGYPLPLSASQIIWLNFVTDGFLMIALALEPESRLTSAKHFIQKQSKWFIDWAMARRMFLVGTVMGLGTIVLFDLFLPYGYARATTVALTVLAVFQWFNAWNCRTEKTIFTRDIFSNHYLTLCLFLVAALQVVAVYSPYFNKILKTVPLTLSEWGIILGVGLTIILVEEARKLCVKVFSKRV